MSLLGEQVAEWVRALRSSRWPAPSVGSIANDHCVPDGLAGIEIEKNKAYFTVWINELFLENGRNWYATYDPMVVVITEFLYGNKRVGIPSVIGPSMIRQKMGHLPHGFLVNDTRAAGPYPFVGGSIAITTILYRVKHQDYISKFLKFIESVSSAIAVPTDFAAYTKIGAALLDGINTLIHLQETEPVAGHHSELDTTGIKGLRSGYTAVIAKPDIPFDELWVQDGRLKSGGPEGPAFRAGDYALYSIMGTEARGNEDELPWSQLRDQAFNDALSGDEYRWRQAKATMLTLYNQMDQSPDLTKTEAERLFKGYREELVRKREVAKETRAMGTRGEDLASSERLEAERIREAVRLLDL